MSSWGINLHLSIGKFVPSPAPGYITEALQAVTVTRSAEGTSGFQMNFHADREKGLSQDYKLLSSPLLKTFNRVLLTVSVKGTPYILMDGFITHQELVHDKDSGAATLTVTGEDVSVAMDIYEYSLEYPQVGDAAIAAIVLGKYAVVGIIPEIMPTPSGMIPITLEPDRYPQQNGTDRCYLQDLASAHGYIFYVKPGPEALMNTAYWGPPLHIGATQKALTVDMGSATNVQRIDFKYDARAPQLVHGMVQDDVTEIDLPLATFAGTRFPYLAADQAVLVNQPYVKNMQFTDPRLGYLRAADMAQSQTNVSLDKVVTVEGELDTLRYGSVLDAPGLVPVRGVGYTYDGTYYVQQVVHQLTRGSYKQQFTLTREGTGSLISEV